MKYILKRTNRKTIAISIVDGKVIVRAPLWLDQQHIDAFVETKSTWIQKKLLAYRPMGIDVASDFVRLYGEKIPIIRNQGRKFNVQLNGALFVTLPNMNDIETLNKKVEDTLKPEFINYLTPLVEKYARLLKIKTPPFMVRRYKRIHGRCNSKGDLSFNLYLMQESKEFIEYVVLHECAHILEFNHSKAFYQIIETHMPNYKAIIKANKVQ